MFEMALGSGEFPQFEAEKKNPSEFTLKKLVRRLHIHEPAQHGQALLGYK